MVGLSDGEYTNSNGAGRFLWAPAGVGGILDFRRSGPLAGLGMPGMGILRGCFEVGSRDGSHMPGYDGLLRESDLWVLRGVLVRRMPSRPGFRA